MNLYTLSFIIATRNRLPFLKITLGKLISGLQPGEEIVVVDGDSADGSKAYLQQLFTEGKIHQFISEPDHNQAHGWNKALLMARGTIIKKIIDDDVYSYPSIRKCADFMLAHPGVNVCISNGLEANLLNPENINKNSRLKYYEAWKAGKTDCFTFCDVYMLIRKNALSYLGLYDTQFTMMDWEYSLRCSFLRANIAYYTGYNSLAVSTPGNVSSTASKALLKNEGEIGKQRYNYPGDRADISFYSELKIAIGKALKNKHPAESSSPSAIQIPPFEQLTLVYNKFYESLEAHNLKGDYLLIS